MRKQTCLNGEWNFTPFYDGFEPGEALDSPAPEAVIRVPSSWRFRLAGSPERTYPCQHYNLFDYPEEWNAADTGLLTRFVGARRQNGRRLRLVFHGILQSYRIYVNGRLALRGCEGFLPVEVDVTDFLPEDAAGFELAVWCGPFPTVMAVYGKKRVAPDGTWFAGMARGIWQDVFLEELPETHAGDCRVVTSTREKSIRIEAEIVNRSRGAKRLAVRASILDGGETAKILESEQIPVAAGETAEAALSAPWPDAVCWSPEIPHLYGLKIAILDGGGETDLWETRFGFREVWAEGHKFFLNGKRMNLRSDAWHYQGFVQQTKAYALNWYRLAKESGINFIRLHGMPYPALYLEAADEAGMMLIGESAVYGSAKSIQADDPEFLENCRKHLEGVMRRDRNHPSIVMWSMQNEMRWVDGRDVYKRHIRPLMDAMERLDGTRLISCDGDNRLLDPKDFQVVSMHYNIDGTVAAWDKKLPLVFGEHGKWHYISPQVASDFVGQAAYRGFADAQRNLGLSEAMFIEYARKEEVTGVSPFNMVNYMMNAMPETDRFPADGDITAPGPHPRRIPAFSAPLNNGFYESEKPFCPNEAQPFVKEAFAPVAVFADEYNDSFYAGETVTRRFTAYNDTSSDRDGLVRCRVCTGAEALSESENHFFHPAGEAYAFETGFQTPDVSERETVTLLAELFHDGVKAAACAKEYRIYPSSLKTEPLPVEGRAFAYAGGEDGFRTVKALVPGAVRLERVTETALENTDVLIFHKNPKEKPSVLRPVLENFALRGGVIVMLEQDSFAFGAPELSGKKFPAAFVNDADHPILRGLGDADFRFWDGANPFGPACRGVTANAFKKPADGGCRILLECAEGDFGWGGLLWTPLAEYNIGGGKLVLCQLDIIRNYDAVPQAALLLRNLLEYAGAAGKGRGGAAYDKKALVLPAAGIENEDIPELRRDMENGAALLVTCAEPEDAPKLSALAGKPVGVERAEAYQVIGTGHPLVRGVSDHDLYGLEFVTYSAPTSAGLSNRVVCGCAVSADGAEALLRNARNPWKEFFVDGLDMEPLKMRAAAMAERAPAPDRCYGFALPVGMGLLVVSQVKNSGHEKETRFYGRLLANLGAEAQTDVLASVKDERDFGFPMVMAKKYDGAFPAEEMTAHYAARDYRLNNLGEGVYGYFRKYAKKDGFIRLGDGNGGVFFVTLFIESEVNRNPLRREEGTLPDPTIVPDLLIQTNASLTVWLNGAVLREFENPGGETAEIKAADCALDRGLNNLLIVCRRKGPGDILLNAVFLNKYGDPAEGLKHHLTLD